VALDANGYNTNPLGTSGRQRLVETPSTAVAADWKR